MDKLGYSTPPLPATPATTIDDARIEDYHSDDIRIEQDSGDQYNREIMDGGDARR